MCAWRGGAPKKATTQAREETTPQKRKQENTPRLEDETDQHPSDKKAKTGRKGETEEAWEKTVTHSRAQTCTHPLWVKRKEGQEIESEQRV